MASIRQIFMLFIFVALLCQFGQTHDRSKRHVDGLYKLFKSILHPLDLKYLRFRQRLHPSRFAPESNDNIEFPDDIYTPWAKFDDYKDSLESGDFLSNPFEDNDEYYKNSKEDYFNNLSKEKYDKNEEEHAKNKKDDRKSKGSKHEEPKSKPNYEKQNMKPKEEKASNKNPYFYISDDIEQLKRVIEEENSYNSPESFLLYLFRTYGFNQATYDMYTALQSLFPPLNPADYVSYPGVPKTNAGPSFIPNRPINIPVDVQNNGAPYTRPPKDILGNLIQKINMPPTSNKPIDKIEYPGLNGGINNRFNPLTIPNYGNFGNKRRPNYVPIGGSIIDGYYPNPWQQMYYLIQLSNGQVVLVPNKVLFGPNKGPLAPGYTPNFLPNNNPIFGPGQYIPRIDYYDYLFPFNYGLDKRYVPGGNLRKPRRIQSSYQTKFKNIEPFHDTSVAIEDEVELYSKEQIIEIDAKEEVKTKGENKDYIKYD